MSPAIPYSAEKDDLYYPGKHAVFFPAGRPKSDAALCVEMARLAYGRQESDFAFDRSRIRKVLGSIGFTDCRFFEGGSAPSWKGSHCFLALQEDGRSNDNLAVVSFRGTDKDDPTDLAHDFNVWPERWKVSGSVHTGFADALAQVEPDLVGALQSLKCKTLFTGHSLGAAMATLLASLRKPDALYTFGSPRVGDADFVSTLKGVDNHRYVDCCDAVARVPPEFMGYRHAGKPYYIDRNRKVKFDPKDSFVEDDQLQAEKEYLEKYAWRIGDVALRPLADHAPVNYVWPVTADQP